MLKAILFDFDGTIVDSLKYYLTAYQKTLAHFGVKLTDREVIEKLFYNTLTQEEVFKQHQIEVEKFWEKQNLEVDKAFKDLELHEHISNVLKDLRKQRFKLGVVSLAPSSRVKNQINKLKLDRYFDIILGRGDVVNNKPHPEIVQMAMRELKVKKEETLLIGDTDLDMETAKNAGVFTALYLPITNRMFIDMDLYRQLEPDFTFETYLELPKKLNRIK